MSHVCTEHTDMAEDLQETYTNLDWKLEGKYDTMKLK